ncbi:MAG: ABC transporter ATP-binding protein/permease [Synechococcaceae bacterium WB9_4xC_028]|jgi:putative ATP-binding cassette transporter|uniref:ABC transporter ATP-binding protein/permease n=1 Tax=unclassified Synechococcus TaxID=2626047 RepID=UPI00103F8108|nr:MULTISPECIES: ABC transporter ATP-binding protein/permease [unclassified Synechococcus]NDD44418.1 ABC transporter ATP-binding protein/permease [Synechococcaceae bacterium WB9_4xB_025]NDD69234.1 ABC transporter ATP-binding protein/permease [Synechococcaceae bacterium WB9_4xC_028]QNG27358.1 ABC transporter ATP-binding protein/permease [Synechococcus sp. HK01-R]TCD55877.1 ABC transporter ATP-binding protein [Synechococcus sp. BS56D]
MTTLPSKVPFEALRRQLAKLRHLAQPFFLPLDQASGWQFVWLLISLLFCVGGVVLLLLTGLMQLLAKLQPLITEKYFGGVLSTLTTIWSGWWGWGFATLFLIGAASFLAMRQQLRNRRWLHWLLLAVIVLMLLAVNGINAGISFIARDLTNALVAKQQEGFYRILIIYASCFVVALPIRVSQIFFTLKLGIIWRDWLSRSLIADYMSNRAYYVLNPNDEQATDVDNPDQRITDDTRAFTAQSLQFTLGIFDALLTFSLNILILWSISTTLTFSLFAYAAFATTVLIVAGRKLVRINFDQLRYEADFRYGLVHVRDNAESIAFYAGEKPEQEETQRRLGSVVRNFNLLIIWRVVIDVMRRSIGYASNFFPYLVMAAPYFAGEIDYGGFIQANFAFGMVESSLFFVVNQIEELAQFTAGITRLEGFQSKVEQVSQQAPDATGATVRDRDSILVDHADLVPPGARTPIIRDLTLSVGDTDKLLVVGPSGCGKTSLLRMVSGLWSPEQGRIERPPTGDLLFIPQKPYMLLGSLREQLCYPTDEARFSDDQLRAVLEQVRLPQLVSRYPDLDVKQDWPRILSLGEQQRLAFGRLLLNAPRFVVLDEATSALDVKTEEHLYQLLIDRDLAFISVGHRPTLLSFHDTVLELIGNGDWRLIPTASYDVSQS